MAEVLQAVVDAEDRCCHHGGTSGAVSILDNLHEYDLFEKAWQ